MKKNKIKNNIVIYQAKNGAIELRGDFTHETIWANLNQIANLFGRDKSVVSRHIKDIFVNEELNPKTTVAKNATVQIEGNRKIKREIEYFNLDVILSVGYRVNSKQATNFRIWATKTLKEYLIKGYAINEKYLLEAKQKFKELQNTVAFLQEKSKKELLSGQEGEILNLLASYAKTLTILGEYDKGELKEAKGEKGSFFITYEKCLEIIVEIRKELTSKKEASELFASERDGSFGGIIKGLYQTFGGNELYKKAVKRKSTTMR